jgi:hypothetical protein
MAESTRRRPRTGEKRKTNQPLKIDRLPIEVRDAIQYLRNTANKTWEEIEELSSLPYNAKWKTDGGGFVPWEELPTPVLELFPDLRLPLTNLHRWYDLRVSQVTAETLRRSAQARELAEAFAKSAVKRDDLAVLNAARDQLMFLLAADASSDARLVAAKGLIALAQKMQTARLNDLRERKVGVDERKLKVLEDRERQTRERFDQETKAAAKKGTGQFDLAQINLLRERVMGLPPLKADQ